MSKPGYVTLVGFVATEPRLNAFDDGDVANLRIGSTNSWLDRETGEWRNGETSFYSVRCKRSLARNAKSCLRKGQPIVVAGKLRTRSYQDRNGVQRLDVEVDADTIGYDLSRGTAEFRSTQRASADLSALARGEAIRAGLDVEDDPGPAGTGVLAGADDADGMFDDQAVAGLQHDLSASAAEPPPADGARVRFARGRLTAPESGPDDPSHGTHSPYAPVSSGDAVRWPCGAE